MLVWLKNILQLFTDVTDIYRLLQVFSLFFQSAAMWSGAPPRTSAQLPAKHFPHPPHFHQEDHAHCHHHGPGSQWQPWQTGSGFVSLIKVCLWTGSRSVLVPLYSSSTQQNRKKMKKKRSHRAEVYWKYSAGVSSTGRVLQNKSSSFFIIIIVFVIKGFCLYRVILHVFFFAKSLNLFWGLKKKLIRTSRVGMSGIEVSRVGTLGNGTSGVRKHLDWENLWIQNVWSLNARIRKTSEVRKRQELENIWSR